jgi:c-di-GMP-binding flagellar brake protein YcgR
MFVLDEEKLNLILTEMSEGFVKNPIEIALFSVLIIGIIVAVVLLYRRQLRAAREQRLRHSQQIFSRAVRERKLQLGEVSLLESMAGHLNAPDLKHLLVENQGSFNTCAAKLLESGGAASSEIAALRLKLGFRPRSLEQPLHSTAQLFEDLPVIVVQKGRQGCRGRIDRIEPHILGIEVGDGSIPLKRGLPVQVYFQTPSGRFVFSTRIRKVGKGYIEVVHSERIKRLQRRQFYRKRIMLPIYVKRAGPDERTQLTTLIDLGGGGASIANRELNCEAGERVSLSLLAPKKERIDIAGLVLRVSRGGKIAHVRFDHILEADRDRIMNILFRPVKK